MTTIPTLETDTTWGAARPMGHRRTRIGCLLLVALALAGPGAIATGFGQPRSDLPVIDQPVTDLAGVIDPASAASIDRLSRALQQASGDAVVVVTVPTVAPYADIDEYAVKLFENHGRGIGTRGQDNGVLIVLAVRERRVRVEVGYGLEQWITDGFAGQASREDMAPLFRQGQYGQGLLNGTSRIVSRIAQGRNVTLQDVPRPRRVETRQTGVPLWAIIVFFIIIILISRSMGGPGGGRRSGVRRWGRYGGWSSGVGPFGGGFGGGYSGGGWGGGGGFGGGFGGFGGGRSGGGGGGASW